MALENVTYINSLNPSNPGPLDSVSQGDDHIRNIKKALVDTFPYVNGQIPLTTSDFQDLKAFLDNGAGYDDTGVKNDIAALESGLASVEQDIISANNAISSEASTRKAADDALLSQIARVEADLDALGGIFASVRYANGSILYGHNVPSNGVTVTPNGLGMTVTFDKPTPNFDSQYAVLLQPYATSGMHTILTVIAQDSQSVSFTGIAFDGASWVPQGQVDFSMVLVDMEQG